MLIDSHCHVLNSEYDNINEIIENAREKGVQKIIINGYDIKTSVNAVEIANKYEDVYAAIGIGPESVNDFGKEDINILNDLISHPKVVAIGEIGLDYYWTKENEKEQINLFRLMLELAKNNNLPVIVHSRNSIEQTYNLLKNYGVQGIMHCYSGSFEMAKKFIDLGFLIGVGGIITFKNSKKINDVVKNIDLKHVALETDSPYLTPEPCRGKKNEPSYVPLIASKIAEIKEVSYDEVATATSEAVMLKFDLK